MKEYQSYRDVYFEVEKISDNNFIAKSFNIEYIDEIKSSSYKECINLMVAQIDKLLSYCNENGIILRQSIPDGIDTFGKILKDYSSNSILRNSHLLRLRNLVMSKNFDLIRDLVMNGKVFDLEYGHELGFQQVSILNGHPSEYFLFVCPINECSWLRFSDSKNIIRQFKIDGNSLIFEFIDSHGGSGPFLEFFHFEYCDFFGCHKHGSLEIKKESGIYMYKIFNAEDLFFQNNSGYCVRRNIYDWTENIFPITNCFHQMIDKFNALQFKKRYLISLFLENLMGEIRDIDWLRSFVRNSSELKEILSLWVVKVEDVDYFSKKIHSKYDKVKILKILDGNISNDSLDSDIRTLTDVLSDKDQTEFSKDMILTIEKHCWHLIHLRDNNPLALIVFLNLEYKMTDIKIFDHLCPNEKEYASIKKCLRFRASSLADVDNKAQKINGQYKKIKKYAENNGLPVPILKK